jgi:hypothetical protein
MNKSTGSKDIMHDKSEGGKGMKKQDSKKKFVDETRSGGLVRNPLDGINVPHAIKLVFNSLNLRSKAFE